MTPSSSPSKTTISLRLSKAELVLVFITMLWGGTFLLVHNVMTVSGPMFFVGLRFAAAALFVGLVSARSLPGLTLTELKAGMLIGVSIMLGYGLQTMGLQTISSSQSAFITALYVPFVPLLLNPDLDQATIFDGVQYFVHAAFEHVEGRYRGGEGDDPEGFRRANVEGSARLFEAARAAGVKRCVFLSSRAVYGTELAGIAPPGPIPPFVTELDRAQLARLAPVARALREPTA